MHLQEMPISEVMRALLTIALEAGDYFPIPRASERASCSDNLNVYLLCVLGLGGGGGDRGNRDLLCVLSRPMKTGLSSRLFWSAQGKTQRS
jgi:hypothetical protein